MLMSQDLQAALRQRGMRVTPQRVVVHRALLELDRHVTADELLDAVTERLPSVSLPTIYATLELLEELGMVRRVQRAGTTLFDPRTDAHHHLVCTTCGSVEDLDSSLESAAVERAARRPRLRARARRGARARPLPRLRLARRPASACVS